MGQTNSALLSGWSTLKPSGTDQFVQRCQFDSIDTRDPAQAAKSGKVLLGQNRCGKGMPFITGDEFGAGEQRARGVDQRLILGKPAG